MTVKVASFLETCYVDASGVEYYYYGVFTVPAGMTLKFTQLVQQTTVVTPMTEATAAAWLANPTMHPAQLAFCEAATKLGS